MWSVRVFLGESYGARAAWLQQRAITTDRRIWLSDRRLLCAAGESVASRTGMERQEAVDILIAYHERTKHSFQKYAKGPHGLDWANQPNPFRRYERCEVLQLDHFPVVGEQSPGDSLYSEVFTGKIDSAPLTKRAISQLLYDSLGLSAWKSAGRSTWSLRVNPSSGNLHPTESYVICGAIPGLYDVPFISHYAPKEHALEVRAELSEDFWSSLTIGLPQGSILVGFTSIYWREAWKYGERAFRYCNHDVGHAIGAVAVAGANLGWNVSLLDGIATSSLDRLFGLVSTHPKDTLQVSKSVVSKPQRGVFADLEVEHADCLLALFPWDRGEAALSKNSITPLESPIVESYVDKLKFFGRANSLSKEHLHWEVITMASIASRKPNHSEPVFSPGSRPVAESFIGKAVYEPFSLRHVVRKRRSAVDMDGRYGIPKEIFFQMLLKATPVVDNMVPYGVLPWAPKVHLAIFVHRVVGLPRGMYFLVRNTSHQKMLKEAMSPGFSWEKPDGCPEELLLFCLSTGDWRENAARLSCNQEIAGNSFFSLGMLAHFAPVLRESGPWMYPRLFWEAGLVGQMLYLEATAVGVSATGIGCYFDDPVHDELGLTGNEFQSLYHFTIGMPILDNRILTLPAYPGPAEDG